MEKLLSNLNMIKCVAGVITIMAPGRKPRNLQKIVDYVDSYFREKCTHRKKYYCGDRLVMFYIDHNEIYDFTDEMLKGCKEFNDLNLSQDEIDRGIAVDDPSRPKWVIGGASDGTHLKEYYDFIDLDAGVRNIVSELEWELLDNDLYSGRAEIVYKDTQTQNVEE